MKILQLTHRLTFPPNDGGKIGIYNFTKNFTVLGHEVSLVSIAPINEQNIDITGLEDVTVSCKIFYKNVINKSLDVIKNSFFSQLPYNMEKYIFEDVEKYILNLLNQENFDIVHIDHLHMAYYGRKIKEVYPNLPIALREHNVEYTILERVAKNEKNLLKKIIFNIQARRLKLYEELTVQYFDKVLVITNEDNEKLKLVLPHEKLAVVPAGVDIKSFPRVNTGEKCQNKYIVSVGSMDWLPNQDGLVWFIENVMPRLLEKDSGIKLFIAGRGVPSWFYKYESDSIKILGFVENANQLIENSCIAIVPLFAGGGMRVKILNYFSWGIPTVSTTIGAEGIDISNKKDIYIADTVDSFVKSIRLLLNDNYIYKEISNNAYKKVCYKYSWSEIVKKTLKVYEGLLK